MLEKSHVSGEFIVSYLHQNYLDFFPALDDVIRATHYLSDADHLTTNWTVSRNNCAIHVVFFLVCVSIAAWWSPAPVVIIVVIVAQTLPTPTVPAACTSSPLPPALPIARGGDSRDGHAMAR